jgi:carboxylesterase type B
MQPRRFDGSSRSAVAPDDSEDCLTLNVWTTNLARTNAPLPVIVWIHGGSNIAGSSSWSHYDGARLSARGAVVVSVNYRLGAFGFLAHPAFAREVRSGTAGNYAFMDVIAALQWVQRNIGAFGGDSSRVTVYGQSAGDSASYLAFGETIVRRASLGSGVCGWMEPALRRLWKTRE